MLMTWETPWLPEVEATESDEPTAVRESKRAKGPDAVP
jgi:hypothetical protein